ncbi:MAG: ABC transporter ATP-binding protein [Bacteroidales bacterium]|nr:ABC transporter ATP-binding protein [Bacteroidales bacterium]
MVEAVNIHRSFGDLEVLKGIHLKVETGEVVSLVGASGAGKSTLLHILGAIDFADQGEVVIDGIHTRELNEKKLAAFRNRKIGFVFQFHHLLPEFTALENVCIPAFIAGAPKKATEYKASELLTYLGMMNRASHKPSQLSGGEQQRVAVARALINNPAVILADEPSGNLDSVNAAELHELIFRLRKEFSQTFIIATHDGNLAAMADRKLTIRDGVIIHVNHNN